VPTVRTDEEVVTEDSSNEQTMYYRDLRHHRTPPKSDATTILQTLPEVADQLEAIAAAKDDAVAARPL